MSELLITIPQHSRAKSYPYRANTLRQFFTRIFFEITLLSVNPVWAESGGCCNTAICRTVWSSCTNGSSLLVVTFTQHSKADSRCKLIQHIHQTFGLKEEILIYHPQLYRSSLVTMQRVITRCQFFNMTEFSWAEKCWGMIRF